MTNDAIKTYVIAYTENKQHHEVIWHALSVKDALWSMEASYIDPADFRKVSNVEVYEVVSTSRLSTLEAAVEERDGTIKKLRDALMPFSEIAKHYDTVYGNRPKNDNDPTMAWGSGFGKQAEDDVITVGDYRRARALIAETAPKVQS